VSIDAVIVTPEGSKLSPRLIFKFIKMRKKNSFIFKIVAVLIFCISLAVCITVFRDGGLDDKHGLDYFFTLCGAMVPIVICIFCAVWFILLVDDI
jgi:hypothetical protein